MNIYVKVEGTTNSVALDVGEIYEMDLGESESYCENNGISHNYDAIKREVKGRSESMGDKLIDITLR